MEAFIIIIILSLLPKIGLFFGILPLLDSDSVDTDKRHTAIDYTLQ